MGEREKKTGTSQKGEVITRNPGRAVCMEGKKKIKKRKEKK